MTPVEEADEFTGDLMSMLWEYVGDRDYAISLERVGFGAIKVQLPSGTQLMIEVGVAE